MTVQVAETVIPILLDEDLYTPRYQRFLEIVHIAGSSAHSRERCWKGNGGSR